MHNKVIIYYDWYYDVHVTNFLLHNIVLFIINIIKQREKVSIHFMQHTDKEARKKNLHS